MESESQKENQTMKIPIQRGRITAASTINLSNVDTRRTSIQSRILGGGLSPFFIASSVAVAFGRTVDELRGPRGSEPLCWARHIAIYLMDELTTASSLEIGKLINRDHSTVIWARQTVSERIETDAKAREQVETLRKAITA